MKIKIGTFNAENLFLRYKFLATEGEKRGKKKIDISKFINEGGHIYDLNVGFDHFDDKQRENTAQVILENDPGVICLQEVENIETLKKFNNRYLKRRYAYSMLIDGNDPRKIDVGILSKFKIGAVRTHQFDRDAKGKIFSRDCLEADIILDKNENKCLTLYVNHLKSKLGGEEGTAGKRERQSTRIAEIINERFGDDDDANFVVAGDFNDTPDAECLQPILGNKKLENVVSRLPKKEQWTHYWKSKNKISQLDYILLSGAISDKSDALPVIERRGLADYAKDYYDGPRFPGVGPEGTEASDHCGVFMEINI